MRGAQPQRPRSFGRIENTRECGGGARGYTYHQCKRLGCLIFVSDDLNTITSVLHYLKAGQSSGVRNNVFPLAEELILRRTRTPSLMYDELASSSKWLGLATGDSMGKHVRFLLGQVFVSL
jgi:hypothetical protein